MSRMNQLKSAVVVFAWKKIWTLLDQDGTWLKTTGHIYHVELSDWSYIRQILSKGFPHDWRSSQNPFFFYCSSAPLKLCGKVCPLWCTNVPDWVEVYSISSRHHQYLSVNTQKKCWKTWSQNMITLNFTVASTQIPGSSPSHWSYYYVREVFIQSVLYFIFFNDSLICFCDWIHITSGMGGRWMH